MTGPVVAGLVLAWLAIVLLAFAVAGLLAQVRELRQAYVDLATSTNAELVPPVPELASGQPALVLVVTTGCETCRQVAPSFASSPPAGRASTRRMILATDHTWEEWATPDCPVLVRPALHGRLRLQVFPSLLMLDEDGRVLWSEPVGSLEALTRLLDGAGVRAGRS